MSMLNLLERLDGVTARPRAFTGPISKVHGIEYCKQLPVILFEKIEVDFLQVTANNLSTDQKYLFEIIIFYSRT